MKPDHGAYSRYRYHGCRCRVCRKANADYGRARTRRIRETACRVCDRIGKPRALEATIGPRFKMVGEMILCDSHSDPGMVETGWWQPGAKLVAR